MEKSLNQIENYIHEMRYKNIDNIRVRRWLSTILERLSIPIY